MHIIGGKRLVYPEGPDVPDVPEVPDVPPYLDWL